MKRSAPVALASRGRAVAGQWTGTERALKTGEESGESRVPRISKFLMISHQEMEARVGIERFMLCFLRKFSHQILGSQGYSATTQLNPILLVHYSATEAFTEGHSIKKRRSSRSEAPTGLYP